MNTTRSSIDDTLQKGEKINDNIIKMIISEASEGTVDYVWVKGANAKIYYQVHAFIHPHTPSKKQKMSHACCSLHSNPSDYSSSSSSDKNQHTHNEEEEDEKVKPERRFICSSKSYTDNAPFELRIGYGFSVKALESSIKSMKVGERARFLWLSADDTSGYLDLEKALRKEKHNCMLMEQGLPPLPTHMCGAHMSTDFMSTLHAIDELQGVPLEFDIELVEIQSPNNVIKEPWELDNSTKLKEAIQAKLKGNQFYKDNNFTQALEWYTRAITLMESLISSNQIQDLNRDFNLHQDKIQRQEALIKRDAIRIQRGELHPYKVPSTTVKSEVIHNTMESEFNVKELDQLEQECRSNYAATQLKLKNYPQVINQCTCVLEKNANHLKSYFRRGQAHYFLGKNLDFARKDFHSFRNLLQAQSVPENSSEYRELDRMEKLIASKEGQSAEVYSNCFKNIFN